MECIDEGNILKQWYINYINYFREEYRKLSADEKIGIGNTNNFLKPCQIEIFWITDPDYQLIIQSNFNDRADKEVIINGPYKPQEFCANAIKALEDKRWARALTQNPMYRYKQINTLGERMATEIYRIIETIKNNIFEIQRTHPNTLEMTVEDTWTCTYMGNIGNLDYIQEVNKTIQTIKYDAKIKQEQQPILSQSTQLPDDEYDGFGVYFYPPIITGNERKRTIKELIFNTYKPLTRNNKVFDMKIDGSQIIVTSDGFIFVEG